MNEFVARTQVQSRLLQRQTAGMNDVVAFEDIIQFCRDSWRTMAKGVLVCVGLALLYLIKTPTSYTATTTVIFDPAGVPSLSERAQAVESSADQSTRIDSQVEVIKSGELASSVIQAMELTKQLDFRSSVSIVGLLADLFPATGQNDPAVSAETRELRYAASVFADRLSVRRVGRSAVIEVSFRALSSEQASQIANKIADTYIARDVEGKSNAAQRSSGWLAGRMNDLRQQAFDARHEVERFKGVGGQSASESNVKLAELESIAQTTRRIYEEFLMKFSETAQKVTYPVSDARVVSYASPALASSQPQKALVLAFSVFVGFAAGTGIALLGQSLDRKSRSPQRIMRETGVPVLGYLNRLDLLDEQRRGSFGKRSRRKKAAANDECTVANADALLTHALSGHQGFAADMRRIRSAISTELRAPKSRCIGVVSVNPGEGSTILACNLAALTELAGARTLLVDASLTNARISRTFAPGARAGLFQALHEPELLPGLVVTPTEIRTAVLPLGTPQTPATPGDLIGAQRSTLQPHDFLRTFDFCIFDLPSLAQSSDARMVGPHLDGLVVVAAYGKTDRVMLAQEIATLRAVHCNILGIVLNSVPAIIRQRWS